MNVRIKCRPATTDNGITDYAGWPDVKVVAIGDDGQEVDISDRVTKVSFVADARDMDAVRVNLELVGPELDIEAEAASKPAG